VVTLVTRESSSQTTQRHMPGKKRHGGKPLVLVIEEQESVRALLHRVLEAEGCAVMAAVDSAEAIAILADHPDAFDLVIADIAEPGVRGPGGLIRGLARSTKILLLSVGTTAQTDFEETEDGLVLLHRPFRSNALRERIRKLIGDFDSSAGRSGN
jgi:DNA-binding response OmpR family regulator